MKIKDLLTDESKWTTRYCARNVKGKSVLARNPEAVCWCLFGALIKCYDHGGFFDQEELIKTKVHDFIAWNDAPERTFEDVRKLIEELDI